MNILLDTHVALWAISDDERLSEEAKEIILDPDNTIYYSAVSVWEVLLKHNSTSNNLTLSAGDFIEYCKESGYYSLNMTEKHIMAVDTLQRKKSEKEHNDPFDRLLVAQAKSEGFSFVTHDSLIPGYDEKCIISV